MPEGNEVRNGRRRVVVERVIRAEREDEPRQSYDSVSPVNAPLVVASDVLAPSSDWLRTALDVFVEAGADDDASRARRLLRTTGAPVPRRRSVADLPDELRARGITRREAEVLRLVADGMSNAEVADRLSLSVRTVEGSISSLRRKLGVTSRGALIAAGLRWELARRPIR